AAGGHRRRPRCRRALGRERPGAATGRGTGPGAPGRDGPSRHDDAREPARLLPAGSRGRPPRFGRRGQGVRLPDAGRRVLRRPVDDVHRRSGRGRAGAATHLLPRSGLPAAERRRRDGGAVAGPGARLMTDPALPRPRPAAVLALLGGLAVLAGLSVLAADAAGGDTLVLMDAGPIARRGAPVAAVLADLAGALTLGGAAVAGWLLREPADRARALLVVAIAAGATTLLRGASLVLSYAVAPGQPAGPPPFGSDRQWSFVRALGAGLRGGGVPAGATTLLRGASLGLSYAVATGQPVGSPRFGSDLQVFFGTDLGVWLLSGVVLAAATTTIAVLGTSRGIARTVTALASLVAF